MNGYKKFEKGFVFDDRYEVEDICSDKGGMGQVLFVKDIHQKTDQKLVLKYCKELNDSNLTRFTREIRLMTEFNNNLKVIPIVGSNSNYSPPYFIMPYYKNGDLTNITKDLKDNFTYQESIFCSMIDCIQELHSTGKYHRDIKPQNFLLTDDNSVIVSDLGLGVEIGSFTRNTTTKTAQGTEGYYPPEFTDGGFKHIDERSDIYMLGKSFYYLLSNKEPTHIDKSLIKSSLFHIIIKSCSLKKEDRYQNLNELKKAICLAYDVILGRGENQYLISNKLVDAVQREHQSKDLRDFLNIFYSLKNNEQMSLCKKLNFNFFTVLIKLNDSIATIEFLKIYQIMANKLNFDFTFVDTIGKNVKIILDSSTASNETKALSLDILITISQYMNRWESQEICKKFIVSIEDNKLGESISSIILQNQNSFIRNIDISSCKCSNIINTIGLLTKEEEVKKQHESNSTLEL